MRRKPRSTTWEGKGLIGRSIRVEDSDPFDARGKRLVYGRGDHFFSVPALNMDVWLGRDGLLYARFWSRGRDVDWYSYVVYGMPVAKLLKEGRTDRLSQRWVPQRLRCEYDNWVESEF